MSSSTPSFFASDFTHLGNGGGGEGEGEGEGRGRGGEGLLMVSTFGFPTQCFNKQ